MKIVRLPSSLLAAMAFCLLTSAARPAAMPTYVRDAVENAHPIWVFLRDKGPETGVNRLNMPPALSPRVAARMAARGTRYNPMVDRPIYPLYRDEATASGLIIRAESRWLNALSGTIAADRLAALASLECVDSLRPVAESEFPLPEPETPEIETPKPEVPSGGEPYDYGPSLNQILAIQADQLHAIGLDGTGVRIGFLDTGYSLEIEAFTHLKLIGTRDFINRDDDVGDGDTSQMGHGTMTLSTCGGFAPDSLIGVAPGAEYVLAKTEDNTKEVRVEEDYWVAGLEWEDSLGCDLVSSSVGYTKWHTNPADYDGNTAPATIAADLAAARGLLVVNAAGNGGCDPLHPSLVIPADGDSVLTVGASDFHGAIAGFSSCGPTFDGRIKPDVIAPGVSVRVADPRNGKYETGSGTSFATPLVTGVCALLLQKRPSTTPYTLIQALRATGTRADIPEIPYGWGLVRAQEAATWLDTAAIDTGGVDTVAVSRVEVWPNPATSKVTIAVPDDEVGDHLSLRVFTVAGQPVFDTTFQSSRMDWYGNTSGGHRVAAGVYLIWVKTSRREDLLKLAWLPGE